ncbi:MAG TPA: PKD domain-containing protein, partial [Methanoregula sp.]|nr:PKD domain-containing protein [Methanoregula sp.]
FTDTGYGYPAPSSCYWDFGDGMTSLLANTSHQYISSGLYNVSHRVTSPSGTVWVNRTGYILVS